MNRIAAVAFDLFNTLITVDSDALKAAHGMLVHSLRESGLPLEEETFTKSYRDAALRFVEAARKTERETHNRFWISAALERQGFTLHPDDPRVHRAVEAYFSAFYPRSRVIPGTLEMLERLKPAYRLGLLSNFTHGPAARRLIAEAGLEPFFEVILISGELGYRKPSPVTFRNLVERLGLGSERIVYVGDDPEADISGASRAGLRPVWTTYVKDHQVPHVPGILTGDTPPPPREVPRISTWSELFPILSAGP